MKLFKKFFLRPFARNVLRGYKNLIEQRKNYFIEELIANIISSDLGKDQKIAYFDENIKTHQFAIKQKYISYFFSTMSYFNLFILNTLGRKKKLIYPLPNEIIAIIKSKKIQINENFSKILWRLFLLLCFFKSIYKIFTFFLSSFYFIFFKKIFIRNFQSSKIKVFFFLLPEKSLPSSSSENYNLFSWYLKRVRLNHNDAAVSINTTKNNRIRKCKLFSEIKNFNNLKNFLKNSLILTFQNFIDLFSSRWVNLYMSSEIIDYLYCQEISNEDISDNYIFTNSTIFYKPLWTYFFEKKQKKIILIFYSSHTFNINEINYKYEFLWSLVTWKNYIFFDEHQKNFYKKISNKSFEYEIGGVIPHCDNDTEISNQYDFCVFDITPPRKYYYAKQILIDDFFTETKIMKFITDCCEILSDKKFKISIKTKRINPDMTSKKYINFLSNIEKNFKNVKIIDPDISPIKLIKNSSVTITFPFSTPSVIAKLLSKKTIYYYPDDLRRNIYNLNRDIDYIYSKEMLRDWVKKNYNV